MSLASDLQGNYGRWRSQCSPTSKPTTRNAIAQAVAIGLLEKTERRSYCAVSLPNILTYTESADGSARC
jgi:hypothetical protein